MIGPLREFARQHPTWGTCAGMIFLAKDLGKDKQPILGLMDIQVDRNAFGRQIDSFESELEITGLANDRPFPTIFIRAPVVTAVDNDVDVLGRLADGRIVAVRQGHLLATAFHPELTDDLRFHQYFLNLVREAEKEH